PRRTVTSWSSSSSSWRNPSFVNRTGRSSITKPPILSSGNRFDHARKGRRVHLRPPAQTRRVAPDRPPLPGRVQPAQLERPLGAPGRRVGALADQPRHPVVRLPEGDSLGDELLGAVGRVEAGILHGGGQP